MGILRGYDVYLNIVLDEALEEKAGGEKTRIGMVVIRGNSVVMLEVGAFVHDLVASKSNMSLRRSIAFTTRNQGPVDRF